MLMRGALHLAWIVGIVYATIPTFWIAVHPLAAYWRRRGGALPVLVVIWSLLMVAAGGATFAWREQRLYDTWVSWLVWLVFFLLAIRTYRRIGHGFGCARLIGQAELNPQAHEQRLIMTGMHARIRHPIYLAHFVMLTAWTLGSGTVAMFGLWLFAVVSGAIMIRMEDMELEQRFGEEFREYRRRVPAILPRP
jgi:protein-S-isoprenylcysteine O-methyltransferase Ste14